MALELLEIWGVRDMRPCFVFQYEIARVARDALKTNTKAFAADTCRCSICEKVAVAWMPLRILSLIENIQNAFRTCTVLQQQIQKLTRRPESCEGENEGNPWRKLQTH